VLRRWVDCRLGQVGQLNFRGGGGEGVSTGRERGRVLARLGREMSSWSETGWVGGGGGGGGGGEGGGRSCRRS